MKHAEDKERFIELRAEGRSYADIAAQLEVSKTTLIAWGKELAAEVANAKTLRMDALFETYRVAKAKRVEAFGKRLEAILTELDKRDLADVPTVALLKLALGYGDRLKAEAGPLTMLGQERDELLASVIEGNMTRETWPI